jgi:hypothetical protein
MLVRTVAVCTACGALALIVAAAAGVWSVGAALAIGLVLGSLNGPLAQRMVTIPAFSFGAGSLFRLVAFSAVGIGLGALLGMDRVPFVIGGLAGAQLLMAGVAAAHLVRA